LICDHGIVVAALEAQGVAQRDQVDVRATVPAIRRRAVEGARSRLARVA